MMRVFHHKKIFLLLLILCSVSLVQGQEEDVPYSKKLTVKLGMGPTFLAVDYGFHLQNQFELELGKHFVLSATYGEFIDAVTSATEQYFAGRGLLYTYRGGKRVDTTHLHVKEWIEAIRENKLPSCNIDQAFEEGISAAMATLSYKENRKITWDAEKEEIS